MKMKKTFIYLLAMMAVTMFTACGNDEQESKQSFTATINNRAIDGDEVVFSQGTAKVEINYTNNVIQFTTDYKDMSMQSHTITTPSMKMTMQSTYVYSFGDQGIDGYIDISTGMMSYHINANGDNVYSTTQLIYPYLTTTIISENGVNYDHNRSGYMFYLDSKGETAVMQITDYIPDTGGSIQASLLEFTGLNVTPTLTGYNITADEAACVQSDYYNLTDLNVTIDNNCHHIIGSFKIKDHSYKMMGGLFGDNIVLH